MWFVLVADEYEQLGIHVSGGAAFASNFVLWSQSGYFDSTAQAKPLLHLWSLGIEEQFYLIWPLALWAAHRKQFNALHLILGMAALSFTANVLVVYIGHDTVAAFYSPLTRFWELAAGATLAHFARHPIKMSIGLFARSALSVVGALLIAASAFILSEDHKFPGFWALMPVSAATLLIAAGPNALVNRMILSRGPIVWVGLISYPLYLWHWPILSFLRIANGDTPSESIRFAAIAVSIVLAALTYYALEKPLRSVRRLTFTAAPLGVTMGVLACAGFYVALNEGLPIRPKADEVAGLSYEPSQNAARCDDPTLSRLSINFCLVETTDDEQPVTAALIGDSHADDKFPGISQYDRRRWMLVGLSSCPPLLSVQVTINNPGWCDGKYEVIIPWLIAHPEIETVALSFYGQYFAPLPYSADDIAGGAKTGDIVITSRRYSGSAGELFQQGLFETVGALLASGKNVIVFVDAPEFPFFPRDCIRRQNECVLSRDEAEERQRLHRAVIEQLKRRYPAVEIYDPVPLFCGGSSCIFQSGETMLYRDSHHLSLQGSAYFARDFVRRVGR